jgi:hypothetical protein
MDNAEHLNVKTEATTGDTDCIQDGSIVKSVPMLVRAPVKLKTIIGLLDNWSFGV